MTYLNSFLNSKFVRPFLLLLLFFLMAVSSLNIYIDSKLPNEEKIRDIELQIPLKIYTADLKLIGEFGEKRRSPLKFKDIPDLISPFYKNVVISDKEILNCINDKKSQSIIKYWENNS